MGAVFESYVCSLDIVIPKVLHDLGRWVSLLLGFSLDNLKMVQIIGRDESDAHTPEFLA